ncbi:MAG: HipA domain-containing protein [Bacteroidales bacterium]|jgi:serine/threonine-protein kinase HipA|nr:HipA domain-containing protein [Bacteroidales bacterium]
MSTAKITIGGKTISAILPYNSPSKNEEARGLFLKNRERISISGYQEKLSLIQDGDTLRLTEQGEQGTYILKPIPSDLKWAKDAPANEHLTMQIAHHIYGINTAENALVFFMDGLPAYITKRFDVRPDGKKWGVEDFASLAGKTRDEGNDFKYIYSYEEMGYLLQRFVPAWRIEIEKFFTLVIFNYIFSNGDAHLKNFSLMETSSGDYILSPAYDLINTKIHIDDTDFALSKGLFADENEQSHADKSDFIELARRTGVTESRIEKLINPFLETKKEVKEMIMSSQMSARNKKTYIELYIKKTKWFNQRF